MKQYLLLLFLLSSCGIIKGHKNPVVNKGIEIIEDIYPDDNYMEENVENLIENYTGFEIDLTPQTEEEN